MLLQQRLIAIACAVILLGAAKASQAQVVFGNFEDGQTDGFGTLTNSSGVTANAFASPTTGTVITPGTGTDTTQVLDLHGNGFNGGLANGADLGYDFKANGLATQFLANDIITFQWETAPGTQASGFSQLFNIILNAPGGGFTSVGGSGSSSTATTGTVNQFPPFSGQLFTVSINYDAYKANITANPSFIQFAIQTNNTGGAAGPTDFYFDNFTLSAVPEPGSVVLCGLGMATIGLIAKRRKANCA